MRPGFLLLCVASLATAGLAADPVRTAAADRPHWAFQTLRDVAVPAGPPAPVPNPAADPVDAFVAHRLALEGLAISPEADRRALLRRVTLDLTGLPSSPDAVESFATDPDPAAYERVVDRLLASTHFGEFWGRHWLDAAGYSDVMGGDNDAGTIKFAEGKWRYRDYIVRSYNADKPFDRFLVEQLAGDELTDWRGDPVLSDESLDALVATTFLRQASDDTDENELNTPDIRHDIVHRTVEMVANNLLGLTLNCARCHDHKYDPISQRDYYALSAHFLPAFNPDAWLQPKDRNLPESAPAGKKALESANESIDRQAAQLKRRRDEVLDHARDRWREAHLRELPAEVQVPLRAALTIAADQRSEPQRRLVETHAPSITPSTQQVAGALDAGERASVEAYDAALASLAGRRRTWTSLHPVYDTGPAPVAHLLRRGEFNRPADPVEPAFPVVLTAAPRSASTTVRSLTPQGPTSGRRLALAQWLTTPGSPAASLVARVYVNRLWQSLFGTGLVETSDNFGVMGAAPSHPELLEWLAGEFIRDGWRTKPLIRRIVCSAAYRQSSAAPEGARTRQAMSVDPANRLLWRQRLRRLEAGSVRDALLVVSGSLITRIGGIPTPIEAHADGQVVLKPGATNAPGAAHRRSLYVLARRNYTLSLLNTFDEPVMTQNCTRRQASAVVSQSLTLLNDETVVAAAEQFATRVESESPGSDDARRVRRAFQIALGRPPDAAETGLCLASLTAQRQRHRETGASPETAAHRALANLCHVLLNSSEFLSIP